ncbi:MAG: TIGR03757 family integrating conjugative element protein [Woeseia sp.]
MFVSKVPISVSLVIALWLVYTAAAVTEVLPNRLEIFTTSDEPATNLQEVSASLKETDIRVYWLDGIHRFEVELSQRLPADAQSAERAVLERLQHLDKDRRDRVAESALALARAVELGIDRYPAIVIDGQWILYGLTDLSAAVTLYRRWVASLQP